MRREGQPGRMMLQMLSVVLILLLLLHSPILLPSPDIVSNETIYNYERGVSMECIQPAHQTNAQLKLHLRAPPSHSICVCPGAAFPGGRWRRRAPHSRTSFPQPQVAKKYSSRCRWLHGPMAFFSPHLAPFDHWPRSYFV